MTVQGTQTLLGRGVLTTAIPLCAPRYDDGSWIQVENIKEWLTRGIPVSLAINMGVLRDGGPADPGSPNGKMRLQDLDYLLTLAAKNNTALELIQHSNNNFPDAPSSTWDQLLEELDTSAILALTGQEVVGFIEPGDPDPLAQARRDWRMLTNALKASGIAWGQGIVDYIAMADPDAGDTDAVAGVFANSSALWDDPVSIANGVQPITDGVRPGWLRDPYMLPRPTTMDLGSSVVVRGAKDGSGGWLNDPNSGERPWVLGFDNNGAGVEGDGFVQDIERTLQFKILRALGWGLWQMWGMHGDLRCDAVTVNTLASGRGSFGSPATLPGHFSSRHFADFAARLRDAGHIRVGTATQWAQEVLSDFAEGLDVVDNPGLRVPLYDSGEHLNEAMGDVPLPRSMSVKSVGLNASARTSWPVYLNGTPDADGRYTPSPDLFIGRNVTGYKGTEGGIRVHYGGDTDIGTVEFGGVGLAPGLYRVSLAVSDYSSGSAIITTSNLNAVGFRGRFLAEASFAAAQMQARADFHVVRASNLYNQNTGPADGGTVEFYLDLPLNPTPHRTVTVNGAVSSLADGSEAVVGVGTLSRVVPGGRAFVIVEGAALAAGVAFRAEVTNRDEVTVYCLNNTGSPLTIAADDYTAVVEECEPTDQSLLDGGPAQPWTYSWQWRLADDGTIERTLSNFRVDLLRRY